MLFLGVAVEAVGKLVEIVSQQWMFHGLPLSTGLQVALSNIGGMGSFVDQDVIPRLIFRRPASCDFVVPFIRKLEGVIHPDHDTPVSEQLMMNNLPRMIFVAKARHDAEPFFVDIFYAGAWSGFPAFLMEWICLHPTPDENARHEDCCTNFPLGVEV